jgi:hypothetical protein
VTVLTWTCEACNQPIEGDTGRLHVQEWRTAERSDDPDYWHVHHGTCIPADHLTEDGAYVSGYCIDTGQVATRSQLARWTRHLASKNWYAVSGWREMVLRSTGVDVSGDARRVLMYAVDGHRLDENLDVGASATDAG